MYHRDCRSDLQTGCQFSGKLLWSSRSNGKFDRASCQHRRSPPNTLNLETVHLWPFSSDLCCSSSSSASTSSSSSSSASSASSFSSSSAPLSHRAQEKAPHSVPRKQPGLGLAFTGRQYRIFNLGSFLGGSSIPAVVD